MRFLATLLPLFFCLPTLPVAAANFAFRPTADARILSISGGGFENANFASDILSVYTAPGNVQRTLLRFALEALPDPASGERVVAAALTLYASTGFGTSQGKPMEVFRMTVSWDEATVTWNRRTAGAEWSAPGGDFVGVDGFSAGPPYASSTANPADGQAVVWDLTKLVAEWHEGRIPNQGLMLLSYPGNGLTFNQDENPLDARRPVLSVSTQRGPPPISGGWDSQAGQVVLWWPAGQAVVLQENLVAPSSAGWVDSALVPLVEQGRDVVRLAPSPGSRFFRLRGDL